MDALIFLPLDDPDVRKWMLLAWAHCQRRRYNVVAVVHNWCDVMALLTPGMRVVVASLAQVDWLEVVGEREEAIPSPERQRPSRIPADPR